MIDRLIHHPEILSLTGDSYRLRGEDLDTRIGAREREDLGVVDEPVDHRGAAMSSPKISHLLNGLLLVTIIGAHS